MSIILPEVLWVHEKRHVHCWQDFVIEGASDLHEVWASGPGEVVLPVLWVAVDGPSAIGVGARHFLSCRADGPPAWDREAHIVAAEIREELGVGKKVSRVSIRRSECSDIGESVRDEVVWADDGRARERTRHSRPTGLAQLHFRAWRHGGGRGWRRPASGARRCRPRGG